MNWGLTGKEQQQFEQSILKNTYMKQLILLCVLALTFSNRFFAGQGKEKKGGFKKENLLPAAVLPFFQQANRAGANPIFGYKIADFFDAGLSFNVQYVSAKIITHLMTRLNRQPTALVYSCVSTR